MRTAQHFEGENDRRAGQSDHWLTGKFGVVGFPPPGTFDVRNTNTKLGNMYCAVMNNLTFTQSCGCMCGSVAFSVTAEPYFTAICSCTFCQKLTGSDYNVEAMFREHQFDPTKGITTTFTHVSEGSGMAVHVHFCQSCGTSTFLRPDRFPDCVGVFAGSFENPIWFRRDPEAVAYYFTTEAPTGMVIPAGFKTYPGHAKTPDDSFNESIQQLETIIVK